MADTTGARADTNAGVEHWCPGCGVTYLRWGEWLCEACEEEQSHDAAADEAVNLQRETEV